LVKRIRPTVWETMHDEGLLAKDKPFRARGALLLSSVELHFQ
jgi:hypothetical protein